MYIKYQILGFFFKQATKNEVNSVLLKWNAYYKGLSTVNQAIFQNRTLLFLKTTRFLSDSNFFVSHEMKIVISSAFTQLTFGLKTATLSKFNTIFITPSSYSYKNRNQLFDGDVNIKTNRINLSWPAVERGFKISNDALNLCIHEFGHCLLLENTKTTYFSIFSKANFIQLKNTALQQMEKMRKTENSFLRPYASENFMEFFAVSLEAFFEKPQEFSKELPILYDSLARLLRQDPRRKRFPILN